MSTKAAATATLAVLSHRGLLCHITSFQRGLPGDVGRLVATHLAPNDEERRGKFWRIVLKHGNLTSVKRLHSLLQHPEHSTMEEMNDGHVFSWVLRYSRMDVLRWLDDEHAGEDVFPLDQRLLFSACSLGHFDIAEWLFARQTNPRGLPLEIIIPSIVERDGGLEFLQRVYDRWPERFSPAMGEFFQNEAMRGAV